MYSAIPCLDTAFFSQGSERLGEGFDCLVYDGFVVGGGDEEGTTSHDVDVVYKHCASESAGLFRWHGAVYLVVGHGAYVSVTAAVDAEVNVNYG